MKKDSPAYVILFIIAISLVFGTGVAMVHYATQGMLARNEQLHRNRVLTRAFMLNPPSKTIEGYAKAVQEHLVEDTIAVAPVIRHTRTQDIGFRFSGMGFWDRITGILVLSPDRDTIRHIQFLDQKETPGLGARIEEPWFTDQFKGLPIDWDAPDGELIVVGAGEASEANRVDAITGATQTSMALMKILNSELLRFRENCRVEGRDDG